MYKVPCMGSTIYMNQSDVLWVHVCCIVYINNTPISPYILPGNGFANIVVLSIHDHNCIKNHVQTTIQHNSTLLLRQTLPQAGLILFPRQASYSSPGRPHTLPQAVLILFPRQASYSSPGRPHTLPLAGLILFPRQASYSSPGRPHTLPQAGLMHVL